MNPSTIECARVLRDCGIDAVAALDDALSIAIGRIPDSAHEELKRAIGRAMAAVMDETINPAVRAVPELRPSEELWRSVVKARLDARTSRWQAAAESDVVSSR